MHPTSNKTLIVAIGIALLIAGFLRQLGAGEFCFERLVIIFLTNLMFWYFGGKVASAQARKPITKNWWTKQVAFSMIIGITNQIVTFLILFTSFYLVYGFFIFNDLTSHFLTNNLMLNIMAYWVVVGFGFFSNRSEKSAMDHFYVKQNGSSLKVRFDEIKFISADNNTAWIHTQHGRLAIYETLKNLQIQLPDHFQRVHKSTILNVNHTKKYRTLKSGDVEVSLQSDEKIRVSRHYKNDLISVHRIR